MSCSHIQHNSPYCLLNLFSKHVYCQHRGVGKWFNKSENERGKQRVGAIVKWLGLYVWGHRSKDPNLQVIFLPILLEENSVIYPQTVVPWLLTNESLNVVTLADGISHGRRQINEWLLIWLKYTLGCSAFHNYHQIVMPLW